MTLIKDEWKSLSWDKEMPDPLVGTQGSSLNGRFVNKFKTAVAAEDKTVR